MLAVAAAALTCNLAAARATVKAERLTIPASASMSSSPFRADPTLVDGVVCVPLAGGRTAMALTIASGGTAGDTSWAIYIVSNSIASKLALVRGGYKLSLRRKGSDIVETDPVYRSKDPNCCPTGGFDHTQWHWNGTRFAVARTWHDKNFKP